MLKIAYELVQIAQLLTAAMGCCPTTAPQRREKKQWYKHNRKHELQNRKKQRRTVKPETLERPGGKSHEKRKVYRPRNFPNSIPQPDKQMDPHEVKVNNVSKPRPTPQVEHTTAKPPHAVRVVEP